MVVETLHDGLGNLASERFHGGDTQTLGSGTLAEMALPQPPRYQIDSTTVSGVQATATYRSSAGPMTFLSLNQSIDLSTGLPSSSRDTSLVQTNYTYDTLGRLIASHPVGVQDGWVDYVYTPATSPSALAQVDVLLRSNGGGTLLAESLVKYDAFGRIWKQQQKMPDGSFSSRETLYNEMGWKSSVSEVLPASTTPTNGTRTQYLAYDPFGRPTKVTPPDGASHDVNFSYTGVRMVTRSARVGTSYSGGAINETIAYTTEIYDRQGRLYQVKEEADSSSNNTKTTYFYDVGSRISRVRQETSIGTQNRYFTYDQAGFLLSELHPEKSTVTYSSYDARGHAGVRTDGVSTLTFLYDPAERLTLVGQPGVGDLKQFVYGISNAASARTNGRLATARRWNYVPGVVAEVTESYLYVATFGHQGSVSQKNTLTAYKFSPSTTFEPKETFVQSYRYDPLGQVVHIDYPVCTYLTSCPTPAPRAVDFSYTNGYLTAIPGFATSITYHPNGLYNQIAHANGVVDTQVNNPRGMPRPSALSAASGGTTLWSSGTYAYDGTGNVVKTGNSYFLYDHVSRIVDGHVYDSPLGAGSLRSQTYSYDPFGNLNNVGGDAWAAGRATHTAWQTNHLDGGTFDPAGNMVGWNGNTYEYDALGMLTRMAAGGEVWRYVYTADDERIWSLRQAGTGGSGSIFALRDLDGKVLRQYDADLTPGWTMIRDYVYRDGQAIASSYPGEGIHHFSLDHLGTPRLVTSGGSGQSDFYTLTPCRALDTRTQGGPLAAGETRVIPMAGSCGIPSGASAVSLNLTAVDATTGGEMTAYPANVSRPVASAISYPASTNRANNAILALGNDALAFYCNQDSGNAQLILDVNGYFATASAGSVVAYHAYFPFGEELTTLNQDIERKKFTGHERDLNALVGGNPAADDLDYMHARHYNPLVGRFLSVDRHSGDLHRPQSWNGYAYASNNPINRIDPDGLVDFYVTTTFLPSEFSSPQVTNYLRSEDVNAVNLDFSEGTATTTNFQRGLSDPEGVSVYFGHSNMVDSLRFNDGGSDGVVPFSKFSFKNSVVALAACNSATLIENTKVAANQALIGVTSNWEGGLVKAGDLSYITTQLISRLKAGQSVGGIVDGLNKFFSERAKKDPKYQVRIVLKGNRRLGVK